MQEAFGRVWDGPRVAMTPADRPPAHPRLAVVAKTVPEQAWQTVAQFDQRHPLVPLMVVIPGARTFRRSRKVPSRVDWAADPDELAPSTLRLAVRVALERGMRRRLEHKLDERRLEDVGWVVSRVSHEISNPLTSLMTNLEWAQSQVSSAAHGHGTLDLNALLDALRDTYTGACHVSRIAEDLTRSSRSKAHTGIVELRAILDTTRRLASKPLEHVRLKVRHGHGPSVRANETRLCQVFLNLLKNAAQALEDTPDPMIEVVVHPADGDTVTVTVRDNGPGIPSSVARQLFTPWVSSKEGGSGLGLAVSRRYLAQMGAVLRLAETSDRGTTFAVDLKAVAGRRPRPTLVPDPVVRKVRILVIDDTPVVCRSIARALGQQHEVHTVESVDEGLRAVQEEPFDLAIVDLNLPGRGGLEFFDALPGNHAGPPPRLLYLSGEIGDDALAFLETHHLPWARKPVGADRLRDLVVETLQAKAPPA